MNPTATAHALATYMPAREPEREGIGLCLSGGGFRAALFHLGAVRRLNELGILSKLKTISAVSGGSILAAHLAERARPWPAEGTIFADWENRVAVPFRAFIRKNLRTGPMLLRLLPWNWFRSSTGVEALAARLEQRLTGLKLTELPDRPSLVFCATDMAFGVNWVFEEGRIGDYVAGYMSPAPAWPVARAVAASACFPPIFNPLPVRLRPDELQGGEAPPGPRRDAAIRGLRLTDGGTYDNLGLEPVWKAHAVVLVSDGGETFDPEADKGLFWRLNRYLAIVGNQARAVRKRWLISNFIKGELAGAYWGIGSATVNYGPLAPAGYSKALVDDVIEEVRTDMDAFSRAEIAVLENHGYLLAEAAIMRHVPELVSPSPAPFALPHPEWMEETKVREALRDSHRVRLPFGR